MSEKYTLYDVPVKVSRIPWWIKPWLWFVKTEVAGVARIKKFRGTLYIIGENHNVRIVKE